jgi:hypothetical protein
MINYYVPVLLSFGIKQYLVDYVIDDTNSN